ncbi:MAG TPA: protein kinase [Candidatus Acidoferrales bacterium]
MTLTAGTRLGPHEILSLIGAGGMGEVYKARDTRLDRIVAIKVLPAHLADNPELRERFEREARTIASLNHPHICTLYDIGRQDGIDYLVMEYLEGETLAMRLMKGPLPVEQVLRYATEIADALDKAHRKGVTHRDIKPGNVMLIQSGTKLLDFGLAKLKQGAAPDIPQSQLPTLKENPTVQGTILGTLQYMSPEQLEGKVDEMDGRTDIFSFGAVVYEMATGRKAFEGKSSVSLIGAILKDNPPPISSLQPMTPPALDRVVKRCLAKDPEDRWQTARDLEVELRFVAESSVQIAPLPAPPAPPKGAGALGRRSLLMSGVALLVGAVIAGLAIWNLRPAPPQPVTRTVITLPPGDRLSAIDIPGVALSPDGNLLAYGAVRGGTQQIFLRAINSLEARPIPGTEGAVNPFFSPDGQWVGFFQSGNLKKISVTGGASVTLGDVVDSRGASWGSQGTISFAPTAVAALQQVSDAGGMPQPFTRLEKGETSHRWPEYLPGGNAVLFAAGSGNWDDAQVAVQSVGTGERRNLIAGGTYPRYAPSGHLVYARRGSLMAVPFDPDRLEITGAAVPVVEGLQQSTTGEAKYSISATGSLIYVSGGTGQGAQRRLVWVSRNGAEQPLAAPARNYQQPRLSPDGRRVAVQIDEREAQIWLYDLARETTTRLTFEGNRSETPLWTPDGKRVVFYSTKEGPQNLFWQMADGTGGLERLITSEYNHVPMSWSPDGRLLAFTQITAGRDIWVLRLDDRKAEPFLRTPFIEGAAQFSSDGRWLAYVSDESGRPEIYVQPYPGPGGKWQISTDGGTEPMWNRNGRELFYRSGNKMMSVEVTTQPAFSAGRPRMLFERPYVSIPLPQTYQYYDVSPDGQRFLMVKESEQATYATQINVVLNWSEELKQRVPAGKK